MAHKPGRLALLTLTALAILAPVAFAAESVQSSVSIPSGQPDPIITLEGNPYAQGTYAVGVLRLEYTYVGFAFQPGPFATFDLGLSTIQTNGGTTSYPASLFLQQTGSTNLTLSPNPSAFTVAGFPWSSSSVVGISIADAVENDPTLAEDGAVIVANLQLSTNHGAKLGTPTSVQIKIRLVYPTTCVRQFTYLSDRDISGDYGSLTLTYGTHGGNLNKILNMSPISASAAAQVVLLVNTCADDRTVDLRVVPDPRFVFGPGQGNTTFVYSSTDELAPGAIDVATLAAVNQLAHTLDITNLVIPGEHSVLIEVHLVLDGSLNGTNIGSSPFALASGAYDPGGMFTTLDPDVDPNPAGKNVTFSLTPQN